MGIKKTAFIVIILLASMFAFSVAGSPVRAIGATETVSLYGFTPFNAVYDSGKGEIFVTTEGQTFVISDSTNKVVANITGCANGGIAYDSGKNEILRQRKATAGADRARDWRSCRPSGSRRFPCERGKKIAPGPHDIA